MDFNQALQLKKKISNQFLFSREKQYMLANSVHEPSVDELTYEIFNDIFGVSVAGNKELGYHVELLSDQSDLFVTPILEYFNQPEENIIHVLTSPFELLHRKRPLEIGCSVSHRLNNIKGTLGCFVKGLKDGQNYILSTHHVLYNNTDLHDNFIVQPCSLDGGNADDAIGLYNRSLAYYQSDINEFDAAIAGPIKEGINWDIPDVNRNIKEIGLAVDELEVYKIGAVTGTTFGKITSISADIRVNIDGERFDFENQIRIQGYDNEFVTQTPFSFPGDSGSLIIDCKNHTALGLLFAGNKEGVTLANHIGSVLAKLEVGF